MGLTYVTCIQARLRAPVEDITTHRQAASSFLLCSLYYERPQPMSPNVNGLTSLCVNPVL